MYTMSMCMDVWTSAEPMSAVHADKVAVMKGGRIIEHGTYRELLARGVDFHAALDDEGAGSVERPPIGSAHSAPGPSAAPTAAAARTTSASTPPLLPAPDFFQQPEAASVPARQTSGVPQPTGSTGVAAQVSAAGPTHERVPDSQIQGHGEAVAALLDANADDGAAAAEQADCKTLDLAPLLAPTVNGGAVPEAASGALPDPTADPRAPRGRDAEPRGWRDTDGKAAGGRSGSRKGRLVYVRCPFASRSFDDHQVLEEPKSPAHGTQCSPQHGL